MRLLVGAALTLLACGSDPAQPANGAAGNAANGGTSSAGGSSNTAGGTGGGGTVTAGAGTSGSVSPSGGEGGGSSEPQGAGPMKLISRGVPAFASSGMATNANDDKPSSAWSAEALPAWLAYDVSGVPAEERQQVLLAWYCFPASDYLVMEPKAEQQLPLDYVVESNKGEGGGKPPTTGWSEVAKVTANARNARQHVFDLAGGNWVRISVSGASDPAKTMIDVDVYSAPAGGSDGWLFMGDSITYMSTQRAFSDLPELVSKASPGRVPVVVDGALGGTNTTTAQDIIDTSLDQFEGHYIVLAYGTNDHSNEYKMEGLVQKVIAAGKTPVVPHMPWSDQKLEDGPLINQQIDALYAKYPEILRGPDLWKAFENRTDLIPNGDVHPNTEGQEFLRKQWAEVISDAPP